MADESDGSNTLAIVLGIIFFAVVIGGAVALYFLWYKPNSIDKKEEPKSDVNIPSVQEPDEDAPSLNPVTYGTPCRLFNLATNGGYMAPCGTSRHDVCGVDLTLMPDIQFKPVPNVDTYNQRHWALISISGKDNAPVNFGDIVKLQSLSTQANEAQHFAGPCGMSETGESCGIDVTLRSLTNTQNEPEHFQWRIDGGEYGKPVQWGNTVYFKNMHPTPDHGLWLASCGTDGICGTDVTVLDRKTHEDAVRWRIEKI